jgi:hypothetical protein
MVKRKYLFIEGAKETKNGNLREGFSKLLAQLIPGKMPTISMGEGKSQTIDKFKNSNDSKLLCDLDAPEADRKKDLKYYELDKEKDSVFYMIQEMESWFISQPEILDSFYAQEISKKLKKKPASEFAEPDKELQNLTKNTRKGPYKKVNHGVQLLKKLDANRLYNDFPDFKNLIEKLKQI